MLGIKKKRSVEAYIPTASMADIAFLLITFFMVSTTFEVDKTTVDLPVSSINSEVPKGSAFVVLSRVEGGAADDVVLKFSAGKETSFIVPNMADLAGFIQSVTQENTQHVFVIKADRGVAYKEIDEVLAALRRASAHNVVYLTNPEGKKAAAEAG